VSAARCSFVRHAARRAAHSAACVALAALISGCGKAAWHDASTRLADADRAARAAGYRPLAGPNSTFGTFISAGSERWRVHLEAHHAYFIAAACTMGCNALDFDVAEPHGAQIAQDTTAGPTPRLELLAPEEGDFVVTVRWGDCGSAEPCRWVAQVYAKDEMR
jgi:hypothetical protein